jgi:hypothetical protein
MLPFSMVLVGALCLELNGGVFGCQVFNKTLASLELLSRCKVIPCVGVGVLLAYGRVFAICLDGVVNTASAVRVCLHGAAFLDGVCVGSIFLMKLTRCLHFLDGDNYFFRPENVLGVCLCFLDGVECAAGASVSGGFHAVVSC